MSTETTRVALLNTMRNMVRNQSFQSISIDDICAQVHISRRTFYRYYPDKYSLLKEVYDEFFFSKINAEQAYNFWDIFRDICEQVYSDKMFFLHAFEVKGQNGFWEETREILIPYMKRDLPYDDITEKMCNFFALNAIYMMFQLIENWIREGFKTSPTEFSSYIQWAFSVYGKWTYEVATDRPRVPYPKTKEGQLNW